MKRAVLITGCNGGIGQSICRVFRASDYLVIGTDIHEHTKADCDHYIECNLLELVVDGSVHQKFTDCVNNILHDTQCALQALINNAAYQAVKPFRDLSVLAFQSSQQVNVMAPFVLAQRFERHLRDTQGAIVNMGSIHARLTKPGFCGYSTSKAGLSGLTRALALELCGEVTVNTILPAATSTDMLVAGFQDSPENFALLEAYHPVGRIAEPDEVAELALFLCSKNARFVTGAEIPIDGGIGGRLHDPA